jgi:hypothetical protein
MANDARRFSIGLRHEERLSRLRSRGLTQSSPAVEFKPLIRGVKPCAAFPLTHKLNPKEEKS